MKYYAGVGSRQTPDIICLQMTSLAQELETLGYVLRSGHAIGADRAFEVGVKDPNNKEIFVPKNSPIREAYQIAAEIHPAWHNCSEYAKSCHARNICQVLGWDLQKPVEFIICWTPEGKSIGGTRTAIVLAEQRKIPVYNLYNISISNRKFKSFTEVVNDCNTYKK